MSLKLFTHHRFEHQNQLNREVWLKYCLCRCSGDVGDGDEVIRDVRVTWTQFSAGGGGYSDIGMSITKTSLNGKERSLKGLNFISPK